MINSWYLSPAGWDSVKKINILSEHLKVILPEDRFEDHIVKPQLRKVKFIYLFFFIKCPLRIKQMKQI